MSFKQCAAFRPDDQRCKRVASHGDYCYSHRHCAEPEPPKPDPMPAGKITMIDVSAWGICAFCGDAYPQLELRPDGKGKPACRSCWFQADLLDATKPTPGENRYISDFQVAQLAEQRGLDFDAAVTVLLENGFRRERHRNYVFFVRTEAPA